LERRVERNPNILHMFFSHLIEIQYDYTFEEMDLVQTKYKKGPSILEGPSLCTRDYPTWD
jgi:hypothetical protein